MVELGVILFNLLCKEVECVVCYYMFKIDVLYFVVSFYFFFFGGEK